MNKSSKSSSRTKSKQYRRSSKGNTEDKLMLISDPDVPFAIVEAYKAIRTNLMFVLSQKRHNRIVVSSSRPGEGKSTTSVNIAIAFSQIGKRVLIIDADLRKPTINKKLRIENHEGLSTVLGGFCKVGDAVRNLAPDLDVLTAGAIPPNPSELLGSGNMTKLLDALNDYYHLIIIDSPPINVVTDALVVAPKTDGVLMVIAPGKVTHEEVKKSLASIEFAEANLLGTVVNGGMEMHSKGKYAYSKYSYAYK